MANYQRQPLKFQTKGVSLRFPPDLMPEALYPKLINVQPRLLGGLEPRAGYTAFTAFSFTDPIHSIRRINDPFTSDFAIIVGAGGSIFDYTSNVALDTGYAGTTLSMVQTTPRNSPRPWLYLSDATKSSKVNTDLTVYDMGSPPTNTPAIISLGTPVFRYVSIFESPGDWTNGGTAGAAANFVRFSTTIAAILYDDTTANKFWASIKPTVINANFQAGADIIVGGVDNPKIREVFEPITDTAIEGILYDTGTSGKCSIVLASQSTGLRLNAMVLLNGTEYVRVQSVTFGPDQEFSFRCSTVSNHVAGETVTGVASFRVFVDNTYTAGATLTGDAIQTTVAVGTGTLEAAAVVDLANINGHPTSQEDYVHLSVRVSDPSQLIEGRLTLDIDPTTNDFQHNALYITFRASDIQANVASTETALETGESGIQKFTVDANAFNLLDEDTRLGVAKATGLSGLDFLAALRAGQITIEGNTVSGPSTTTPGHTAPRSNLQVPGSTQTHTGQITAQQVEKAKAAASPNNFPVSLQSAPGDIQWAELFFKVSDFTRIGSDPSISLRDVKAAQLQFEVAGSCVFVIDSLWLGGTYGPDNPDQAPYFYTQRGRSQTTGMITNPGPIVRSGLNAEREAINVFPINYSDTQIELIDVFRLGGTVAAWKYVGSTVNGSSATFIDTQTDSDIRSNEELAFIAFQPFPLTDIPRMGTCNVVGTSIEWVSGDLFNGSWATGSEIILNGVPNALYSPPFSTTRLELAANAGVQTSIPFFLADATIDGQPMSSMWGPDPLTGCIFACGEGTGNLYWTNPNDPDSASDANVYPVSSPSEPLQNGFMWNGQPYVWSTEKLYRIVPTNSGPGVQYIAQEVPTSQGLYGKYAFCIGPLVWWVSRHGVMEYDGGSVKAITDDSLYPLFPHDGQVGQTVRDYAPIDVTNLNALHLYYTQDSLYLTTIASSEPPVIVITMDFDCPLSPGTLGVDYEFTLTASGGIEPYTWEIIAGALPDGLSLDADTGVISGTPSVDAEFSFTIKVTDSEGNFTTKSCSLTITGTGECTEFVAPAVWESLHAGDLGGSLGSYNSCQAISASANYIYIGISKTTPASKLMFASAPRTPAPGASSWSYHTLTNDCTGVFGVYALTDDIVYVGDAVANNSNAWRFDRPTLTFTNLGAPDTNVDRYVVIPSTTDTDILYWMTQARLLGGDGATLWTYKISTATWTKIGGTALNGSWSAAQDNKQVVNIAEGTDGFLYVALAGGTVNLAQVWRGNAHVSPTTWTRIGGVANENSGWAAGTFRALRIHWNDTFLYAGLQGATAGDAQGWRWNGSVWNQIAGNTINGSWANGTKLGCAQIASVGNILAFGTYGSLAGDSEVWTCSTSDYAFTQNAGDGINGSWTGRLSTNSLIIDPFLEGYFYVGLGNLLGTGLIYGATVPCVDEA